MYMKKENIIKELNDVYDTLSELDSPDTGMILNDISRVLIKLGQVIHQLDTYKCFIDVRDEHPLGQDKTMRVDSPFNDGNPVNGVKEDE